jgi:hypothetical protein
MLKDFDARLQKGSALVKIRGASTVSRSSAR